MAGGRRGRPRRSPHPSVFTLPRLPLPVPVGDCRVEIEGSSFTCEHQGDDRLLISTAGAANIRISAVGGSRNHIKQKPRSSVSASNQCHDGGEERFVFDDHSFVVLNPKDIDSRSKSLVQEVLKIYMKELPAMNYAANTGKESLFLEKCVSGGKYKTMILRQNPLEGPSEVIAAVSYQIIPTDAQYAEIPLAAVISENQRKGIGHLLYSELRNRLQNVGILTIFCWADEESKGFWLKQGFSCIGDVDGRGRVHRLPIRADIRKALCFPGDSTLMISHLKDTILLDKHHTKIYSCVHGRTSGFREVGKDQDTSKREPVNLLDPPSQRNEDSLSKLDTKIGCLTGKDKCNTTVVSDSRTADDGVKDCSCSQKTAKRCIWEASLSSLKSKRVKGSHLIDCGMVSKWGSSGEHGGDYISSGDLSLDVSECKYLVGSLPTDIHPDLAVNTKEDVAVQNPAAEDFVITDLAPVRKNPKIMFMNIADANKKASLTKIVEGLGGSVTSDGSLCTHVITGKARRTLNFCIALCSGAWILSSSWLKESFREGKFLDESKFILEDEDYTLKYKSALGDALLKARAKPQSLLKGYTVCLAKHVQPPVDVLSIIVKSAGGNVSHRLGNIQDPSKTIFIACEEDMEAAMLAAKRGICTYNSDWFMSCILRQELDFETPQFAESL